MGIEMSHTRAWRVGLMVLLAIVGANAGVVITGIVIGAQTEIGSRVIQAGVPLLLASTMVLVVGSLVFARSQRHR
jgi:hypothetical protein